MIAPARASDSSAEARGLRKRLELAGVSWSERELPRAAAHDLGLERAIDVLRPTDLASLRRAVRCAGDAGAALTVVGGASALGYGGPLGRPAALLSLEVCASPIEHSVPDFVVTAPAGLRFAELQERLSAHGQWLAFEPPDAAVATLGGAISAAATSVLAASYGTLRAALLGMTFVLSDGVLAHAGGRVVKNVSGYDLMKLLHGAAGTLGVIAEVTLRTRPLPAQDRTLSLLCADWQEALAFVPALGCLRDRPAAAWAFDESSGVRVLLRFLGAEAAVARQERDLCAAFPALREKLSSSPSHRDGGWRALQSLLSRGDDPRTLQISLHGLPSELPALVALSATFREVHEPRAATPSAAAVDLSRAVAWWKACVVTRPADEISAALPSLRERAARCRALIQVHAAPEPDRALWALHGAQAGELLALARRMKQALDPAKVLSPGRFGVTAP